MTAEPAEDALRVAIRSRKDEIRSIAAELFEKRGYSGTTMAHIAEAAGVLPGSLYHHFESKEVIAIELLETLQDDFERLRKRLAGDTLESREDELVRLVSEVMAVSYRHAAAVRLLAHEPPTVATVGFRDAVKRNVPALDLQWRSTLNALASTAGASRSDARIARFALQSLSFSASINFPQGTNPVELGSELCRIFLHGVASAVPEDEQLDSSTALGVAKNSTAAWGAAPRRPEELSAPQDKIAAAARLEFARRGYDATTVRDIAKTAGVTMGMLYRHTESKQALMRDVIDSYSAPFDAAMRGVLGSGSSAPEILDALAWVFVSASRRFRAESDMVKVGWLDRADEASPYFDYFRSTEQRLELLKGMLVSGVSDGTLKPIALGDNVASHLRFAMWLPYQDQARNGVNRTHRFLRRTVLGGLLNAPR